MTVAAAAAIVQVSVKRECFRFIVLGWHLRQEQIL